MTSHHTFLRHSAAPMESPAKVFAKLKSRVEKEAMFAKPGRITNNNTPRHARDVHGSGRRTKSTWMMENKENKGLGVYPCDAEALTLSSIATPQKSLGREYEDLSAMSSLHNITHEFTPSKRTPLESTAVFRTPGRKIHSVPGVCKMIVQTPTKPGEGVCAGSVSEHRPPLPLIPLMSPAKVFSSMKEKMRNRNWELDGEPTRERNNFTTLNADNKVEGSVMNLFVTPQVPMKKQRCHLPRVSPTEMFGYVKEWEKKRQQPEGQRFSSSTRGLQNAGHRGCFPDNPETTTFSEEQPASITPDSLSESITPAGATFDVADSQSDDSPVGAERVPVVLSQPVLLRDPLVLQSPQISIPNKRKVAVSMDNKRPVALSHLSVGQESRIYLRNWSVESSRKGLYVDGIHREDGIAWHSNIIAERVSGSTLKTVSGRIYVLVGKMNTGVQSEFPKWFLRKFTHGFPPDWKELYETFLSGAAKCSDAGKEVKRSNKKGSVRSKRVSETADPKQPRQRAASDSSAKVSRSGRMIKPPLEYWKGGRVMLDAHMNVTIHECYDTSICKPEVTTTVSTRVTDTPVRVLLPCGEECEEPPGPRRRVKAQQRKRDQTKDIPGRKPSKPSDPNVGLEPVPAHDISSPEQQCSKVLTSRQRRVVPLRRPQSDSANQVHEANRSSVRLAQKRARATGTPKTGSPAPDLDSSVKRKKTHKKSRAKTQHPSTQPPESPKDGRRRQRRRTAAAQTKPKQRKCATMSPPSPPPEPKAKPSKKHDKSRNTETRRGRDEDEWTEGELRKLHKAVTSYPKHTADYWANVAMVVGTRSAEECHLQHTSKGAQLSPGKRADKPRKAPAAAKKAAPDQPVISARVGTLKRKQQVRQFLEAMPKDDVSDVFSSAHMQSKRFELPSMCPSDDQDFALTDQEPLSPSSVGFPEAKTPQCLHITPGMMGSPSRNDDKYIFQLQRRMKKSQFKVCKQAPPSKSFTPTPSIKRSLKRCGDTEKDTFLIREMFPEKDVVLSDSGEEEDFYFSDDD